MNIEHSKKEDTIEIKPCGPLSYNGAAELSEYIRDHSRGIRKMVIDMKEVDYCSSAGIRALMEIEIYMSKLEGLILYNVNDSIMNVFRMTGIDSIFTIK